MSALNNSRNTQRPPRKKACNSCTRSKVRCSLEKPTCSRCQSTGRLCQYTALAIGKGSLTTKAVAEGPSTSYSNASSFATPHPDPTPHIPIPELSGATPVSTAWSPLNQFQRQITSDWQDQRRLDFTAVDQDLVPSVNAEDIRDRWLRPYVLPPLGRNEPPKVYHPFTLQYISRVLSAYPRCMLKDGGVPPIIHLAQIEAGGMPQSLANCYSLVRMWQNAAPGSETMVVNTLEREMERLAEEHPQHDYELLSAFQAYLIYAIMMYFSPHTAFSPVTDNTVITLMEMAFRTARNGLSCAAEVGHTKPTWESWIVAAAKRRAIFTMYLFSSVYNADKLLPEFVAGEMKGVYAPESKALWTASNRVTWHKEYDRHLLDWEDGMLEISELWKSEETGSAKRRDRLERWLRTVDEFGMMLFGVCAHVHGC